MSNDNTPGLLANPLPILLVALLAARGRPLGPRHEDDERLHWCQRHRPSDLYGDRSLAKMVLDDRFDRFTGAAIIACTVYQ